MRGHRTISRAELAPGMFVVGHGSGSFEDPLVRVEKCLPSIESIALFVPATARTIVVDDERSRSLPATTLAEETQVARKLYAEALEHARDFVEEVRRGKDIDYREAMPLVDGLIDSVLRNESAAATLFKLRWFDEYTYTHSINVSVLAVILGKHQGLDLESLRWLGVAGLFHDIGKARIPEAVLNKPGKLSESEFALMKTHPLEGYKILRDQQGLNSEVLRAVVEHHERADGTGYPRGLSAEGIGRFSRIISVVDVYDALTSRRVYKEPMAPAKALGLMYQWRERDFAPQAIERFIKCIGVYPVGSLVKLSGGEHGIVAEANQEHPTRPKVKLILDRRLRPRLPETIDLDVPAGSPGAQEIESVLNPAELKLDLEPFFLP